MLQNIWTTGILLVLMFALLLVASIATVPAPTPAAEVRSPFVYTFNSPGILHEAGSIEKSSSPYFWINSGGALEISDNTGSTFTDTRPSLDLWQTLYKTSNSLDTDKGENPENLFRLLTRAKWQNVRAQAQFMVTGDNFSASPNRNSSNGLLLMSRYQTGGDTLYYAGVRVDGTAVIKKKYNGSYYTMAQAAVFPGTYEGSQDNENLIPHNKWLGLRSEVRNQADGSVSVTLYLQRPDKTTWEKVLTAIDRGQYGSTQPITQSGYAGLRTDFMDVRFDTYRLESL